MVDRWLDVSNGSESVLFSNRANVGESDRSSLGGTFEGEIPPASNHARPAPDENRRSLEAGDPSSSNGNSDLLAPELAGVPETMLWTLHNRASEALRADGVLVDPSCVKIHAAIDYDFHGRFGPPAGSLAVRAVEIDRQLRDWLELHPDGFVVSLGEGLETQASRVDNGRMRWLSVDLPEAMRIREHFLPPTDRFRHMAMSVLDTQWMDAVEASSGLFVVAQGLLMYLEPDAIRRLLIGIADRFPGAEIVFDVLPGWFSALTLQGLYQTPRYRLPPMPWGVDQDQLQPVLNGWDRRLGAVALVKYSAPRGLSQFVARLMDCMPVARHKAPALARISIPRVPSTHPIPNPMQPEHNQMPVAGRRVANANAIGDLFAAAMSAASRGSDTAVATGQVVAKRVALGMTASRRPRAADCEEFGRMIPEKVEAFSAAGAIMIEQSGSAARQVAQLAYDEMAAASQAAMAMTRCSDRMAYARAHGDFVSSWFDRAASNFVAMGMMALGVQDATMAPIRATVFANERLRRWPR